MIEKTYAVIGAALVWGFAAIVLYRVVVRPTVCAISYVAFEIVCGLRLRKSAKRPWIKLWRVVPGFAIAWWEFLKADIDGRFYEGRWFIGFVAIGEGSEAICHQQEIRWAFQL